jgi:type IV pilus assembly protein PilQ
MTMRNAPAREVLMALAETGGYGFVFVAGTDKDGKPLDTASTQGAPVSIAFRGENYSRAINSVLLSAGLQARLEGNLIVAGPNVLGKSFGTQLSKVYRLNQASANSAADYLASLGATITKVSVITNASTTGTAQANQVAGGATTTQTETQNVTTTETYGANTGPLKGLTGTTDSRLQTITLIGDPLVIAVAENYLRQLDLRQRQVALSVRILDVSLGNDSTLSNSFAFRFGNNFIVNDSGRLIGAFGDYLPPNLSQFNTLSGGASTAKSVVSTLEPGVTQEVTPALYPAPVNPGAAYQSGTFFNQLNAIITSSSTKLLASPTLILTDNPEPIGSRISNEATVTVGTQVITNYTVTTGTAGNGNSCQPQFGTSGLVFDAKVSKIDDNGFVTFSISPSVSASTSLQTVPGCGPINILSQRILKSGAVRVRDGQTLILTGVISDFNSQTSTKWPILGDLPFVGQFFRSSGGSRSKNELVIMVTPRIISDNDGGSYGYGYQPGSAESRQLMGGASQGGF